MKSSAFLKQFLSYFAVGGIAALVEWAMFAIFSSLLRMNYILATCLAFICSTTANWLLGRAWTFRDSRKFQKNKGQEAVLIFGASAIGLLLNILLMFLFVSVFGLNTAILKTFSKMAATGLVFIWNFLIRRFAIYK